MSSGESSGKKFFAVNNANWGFKWGYRDTEFVMNPDRSVSMTGDRYDLCGIEMPEFVPYVEEMLGLPVDFDDEVPEVDPRPVATSRFNEPFLSAVKSEFDEDRYRFDDDERLVHSLGQTTDEVHKVLYDQIERVADMVVYVESEDEVRRLVDLAIEHDVCLIPYGGGTSVSNALQIPEQEQRMVISVDMRRMNQIESIDEMDRRVTAQAGITGTRLEELLRRRGFTVGHEPDSLELSTLGGWISTNASGMKKNRYGNIEDIIENVTMITPRGSVEQIDPVTRASYGVQPQSLLVGSEGNFGIITKATLRMRALPEAEGFNSALFHNWDSGVEFMYELARSGAVPASARLMDNAQFRFGQALTAQRTGLKRLMKKLEKIFVVNLKGFDPSSMVVSTFKLEGSRKEVEFQQYHIKKLARKYGGLIGGAENGKRGYNLTFAIAYIRDFMSKYRIVGETMETTVPWSKVHDVCDAATERLTELHRRHGMPGKPYMSYRMPQIYLTGACIYFMFAMSTHGVNDSIEVFNSIEHSIRDAIVEHGGSISHHHGVGKLRRDFMRNTISPSSVELLRQVKQAQDPKNTFGVRNNVFTD